MKTLKKTLCLVLAVVMAVGVLVLPANAATFTDESKITKDYKDAVTTLINYGILQGKKNGTELTIDPLGDVTRAEVATMTYRMLTGDIGSSYVNNYVNYAGVFSDVTADWQRGPVGFCANGKLVVGIGGDKYAPNAPVTGYELLAIMLRALGYGQLGEFTGAKWKENTYAQAVKSGLDEKVKNIDLSLPLSREKVAQIMYNTITAARVVYTPGLGYTYVHGDPLNTETGRNGNLIEKKDDTAVELDSYGAPKVSAVTHNFNFTWPVDDVKGTWTTPIVPVTYYEAVTECDVATALGLTTTKAYTTYTNGVKNKGLAYIEPIDEVHTIGAQGRETKIYKYTVNGVTSEQIVYKDTVLLVVKSYTQELLDTEGHEVKPARIVADVYGSSAMNGNDGKCFTIDPKAIVLSNLTIEVDDVYSKGDVLCANIITTNPNNTLDKDVTIDTDSLQKATAIPVTVTGIKNNGLAGSNQRVTGFVDANGNSYLYAVSYSFNGIDGTTNGVTINTLDNNDIGKDYVVYVTDHKDSQGNYNVIGVDYANGTNLNYGVVTNIENVQVGTDKYGRPLYAQELTVLTGADTSVTIRTIGKDKAEPFSSLSEIRSAGKGTLIKFSVNPSNSKYYNVETNPVLPDTFIESGVADSVAGLPVNDNTVFFVEKYTMNNVKGGYVTSGYSVYTGFKNIPNLHDGVPAIWDSDNDKFVTHTQMQVTYFDDNRDGYADYVLVRFGTESSPLKPSKSAVNYALVDYTRQQHTAYETYYRFNSLVNGTFADMNINSASFQKVKANGCGLYIYSIDDSGYAYKLEGPVNCIAGSNIWDYTDGVIKVTTPVNIDNTNVKKSYLTVADNTPIYIVNPVNGKVDQTLYDLDVIELAEMYQGADIYFQLNEYGWINLIYVINNMKSGAQPVAPSNISTVEVTLTKKAAEKLNSDTSKLVFYKNATSKLDSTAVSTDVTTGAITVTIGVKDSLIISGLNTTGASGLPAGTHVQLMVGKNYYDAEVSANGTITVPVADMIADQTYGIYDTTAKITIDSVEDSTKITVTNQDEPDAKPHVEYVPKNVLFANLVDQTEDGFVVGYEAEDDITLVKVTYTKPAGQEVYVKGTATNMFASINSANKVVLTPNAKKFDIYTAVDVVVKYDNVNTNKIYFYQSGAMGQEGAIPGFKPFATVTYSHDEDGNMKLVGDVVIADTFKGTGSVDSDTKATIDGTFDGMKAFALHTIDRTGASSEQVNWIARNVIEASDGVITVDLGKTGIASANYDIDVYIHFATPITAAELAKPIEIKEGETKIVEGNVTKGTKLNVSGKGEIVIEGAIEAGAEVTVGAGTTLSAGSIEKGADVSVKVGGQIEVDEWNEAVKLDTGDDSSAFGASDIKNLTPGVYENTGKDLDTSDKKQQNHHYVLSYEVPKDVNKHTSDYMIIKFEGQTSKSVGYLINEKGNSNADNAWRFCLKDLADTTGKYMKATGWQNNETVKVSIFWSTSNSSIAAIAGTEQEICSFTATTETPDSWCDAKA